MWRTWLVLAVQLRRGRCGTVLGMYRLPGALGAVDRHEPQLHRNTRRWYWVVFSRVQGRSPLNTTWHRQHSNTSIRAIKHRQPNDSYEHGSKSYALP